MANFEPIYRAYVFESGGLVRNANGTINLAGSTVLTPAAAADHSDPFKVSTHLGQTGFQPYLSLPRGRRGRTDFLTKRTDVGQLTLDILDRRLLSTDNYQRWATAFFGDDEGRRQLMGKEMYVEESLNNGSSFTPFYLGRVQTTGMPRRLWLRLQLYDLSRELAVKTFRGRPQVSYAHGGALLPVGLIFDYGPHALTPLVPANVGTGSLGGLSTVDTLEVDENEISGTSADSYLTLITRTLHDVAGARVAGFGSPIPGDLQGFGVLQGALAYVRLVGGARDGETGYMRLRPFIVDSEQSGGGPVQVGTNIHGYLNTEQRDRHKYLRSIAVGAVDPAFAVGNWGTTTVEFAIVADGDPTPRAPILIDDVHPVQLWADMLDGKFGPFDRNGVIRQTTPRDVTAFDTLIADQSFPLFRGVIEEPAFTDEWIEKHILQPYNLAFYRDGEGRVVPVDLRSRNAAGALTISDDDILATTTPTSNTDLGRAVTDVSIKYYAEALVQRADLGAIEDLYPDIPSFGLEFAEAFYRVVDIGNPDVPPQRPIEIDALGFRLSPQEEMEQGVEKAVFYKGRFDALVQELRMPFGAGATLISFTARRNATTEAIPQGGLAIVDVAEIADPTTNRRGGPRLGRCLERVESGPGIGFVFLDLGVNVTALAPTLGALALHGGEETRAIEVPVTALNAAGDPVVLHVAITDQAVGVRPVETSPLWFFAALTETATTVIIRNLPADKRAWVRGRSEPNPESGGSLLPSAWVFPSNSSIDVQGITAPTLLDVYEIGGSYIRASFTPGDDTYPTEVWLDGFRRKRIPAGSDDFELRGISPGTTYNSPGLQVRHIDPVTGGVSDFATDTFTSDATITPAPNYIAAALIVGEAG